MGIVVQKYGGSSVADIDKLRLVAGQVADKGVFARLVKGYGGLLSGKGWDRHLGRNLVVGRFGAKAVAFVHVLGADDSAPAARAGLRPGDVIVRFAGSSVETVSDIHRLLIGEPTQTE